MKKCIHTFCLLLTFLLPHQFALSQVDEVVGPHFFTAMKTTANSIQRFYYIPGAYYYGKQAPNIFNITLCSYLEGLLGNDFKIIDEPLSQLPLANVGWALLHGQQPVRHPDKNRKVRLAFNRIIIDDTTGQTDQITIISSSFGSVLASQLAIKLARHYESEAFQPEINLIFGASMVNKDSALFQELIKLQQKGLINYIVYDELQDPGDNVTGMCGKSMLQAFSNAFRMTCVFGGNYLGQPSILNNHPYKGHIHWQRAQSAKKGKDYVQLLLIDKELAGPQVKERALEALSPDR
jgi:hypothetical protein